MGAYILFALLALLALLLFAPVKIEAVWRKEVLSVTVRLLWLFPIRLLPAKEKPERPKKAKKQSPAKAKKEKKQPKGDPAETALAFLGMINDLLPQVGEFLGRTARGITVSRCRVALVVSGEEADQAGIACGRAYALGYGAYSALAGVVRVKEFTYHVFPDFLSGQGAADAEVTIQVRPITLAAAGCILLFHVLKTFLGQKKPQPEARR